MFHIRYYIQRSKQCAGFLRAFFSFCVPVVPVTRVVQSILYPPLLQIKGRPTIRFSSFKRQSDDWNKPSPPSSKRQAEADRGVITYVITPSKSRTPWMEILLF